MSNPDFLQGVQGPSSQSSEFDALHFFVSRLLGRINTATLVRVVSCTNDGGLSPVGSVDVQPLVQQVAADGSLVAQPLLYQLPYFRLQGGSSAVILDPAEGDIGIAIFAGHDITNVKATAAEAGPGSYRRFDLADGLYMGGFVNGLPNQYVQFLPNGAGINLVSPTQITAQAPKIYLNGDVYQSGGSLNAATVVNTPQVNASTDVSVAGLSVINHTHGGVQPGSGNSGAMQN